jgi:hypothetical protein
MERREVIRRHLIIEGPDGAGKDTLIRQIQDHQGWREPFVLHPRASTSTGGPVKDLSVWVAKDTLEMPDLPPSIYNRHPMISDPIYRRFRAQDDRPPEEQAIWNHSGWVTAMRKAVSEQAVVVLCMPPLTRVVTTVTAQGPDAHMPGVVPNISNIYNLYNRLPRVWPGPLVPYNYTTTDPSDVIRRIKAAQR